MTKDEAMAAIKNVRATISSYEESQLAISKIIDQIDNPQRGVSVADLCSLLAAAEKATGNDKISIELFADHSWILAGTNKDGEGILSLRQTLIDMATPPKPKTVLVEVPIEVAESWAQSAITPDWKARAKAALEKAKL